MVPSPESAYAIKAVVDEAIVCRENRDRKNILCVISANSHLDIEALHEFVDGSGAEAETFSEDRSREALGDLPAMPVQDGP